MKTSLYRFYAADDTLLYVGQSRNPFQRLNGHFCDKQMDMVRHIEIEWFDGPAEALKAEGWAIRREGPLWNATAPIKPRKVRVTPKKAYRVSPVALQPEPRPASYRYENIGPHLPPMQGPPKPWKQYGVDLEAVDGVDLDFVFSGGEPAIKRAFKVARRGDVIHMKKGVAPIYHTNLQGFTDVPYVQFH